MARISWDGSSRGVYETGLDRGVLYPKNGIGVPWNGLTKVEGRSKPGQQDSLYYEGQRYDINVEKSENASRVGAYTYPEEMNELAGFYRDGFGMVYGEQPPEFFSMSYRTRVTDGHKIHVLLNQKATFVEPSRNTIAAIPSAVEFNWDLIGAPIVDLAKPTSYVIIDSRYVPPSIYLNIEAALYGDESESASMVRFLDMLRDIAFSEDGFLITRNDGAEWTIIGPDDHISVEDGIFQIQDITHEYLAPGEYRIHAKEI